MNEFKLVALMRKLIRLIFVQIRPASPRILFLEVTTRCNMECRHCDGDDVWGNSRGDLSLEMIRNLSTGLG